MAKKGGGLVFGINEDVGIEKYPLIH